MTSPEQLDAARQAAEAARVELERILASARSLHDQLRLECDLYAEVAPVNGTRPVRVIEWPENDGYVIVHTYYPDKNVLAIKLETLSPETVKMVQERIEVRRHDKSR